MVAYALKDMVLQNDLRINTLLPRESPLCQIGLEGILLILVLMEYGLQVSLAIKTLMESLNPCFNGIWSRTGRT